MLIFEFNGNLVDVIDVPDLQLDTDDDGDPFAFLHIIFSSLLEVVVLVGHVRLVGINSTTGEVLWNHDDAFGTVKTSSAANGEEFIVVGQYGEVSIRSMRTGQVLSRTSVGRSNIGLKLSRDCGLSVFQLRALEQSGAVIV
jgi:hypothetical protein